MARTETRTTMKWLEFSERGWTEEESDDYAISIAPFISYISVWSVLARLLDDDRMWLWLFAMAFAWADAAVIDEADAVEFNWNGDGLGDRFVSVCGIGIWSVFTTVMVDEVVSLFADWCDRIGVIGKVCFKLTGKSSRKARRPSLASSFGTSPRSRQRQSGFW